MRGKITLHLCPCVMRGYTNKEEVILLRKSMRRINEKALVKHRDFRCFTSVFCAVLLLERQCFFILSSNQIEPFRNPPSGFALLPDCFEGMASPREPSGCRLSLPRDSTLTPYSLRVYGI